MPESGFLPGVEGFQCFGLHLLLDEFFQIESQASQLLEFGPKGEFLREIGKGNYAWSFAHTVRIDKDDNIWPSTKAPT